jgi:hypothetical protein
MAGSPLRVRLALRRRAGQPKKGRSNARKRKRQDQRIVPTQKPPMGCGKQVCAKLQPTRSGDPLRYRFPSQHVAPALASPARVEPPAIPARAIQVRLAYASRLALSSSESSKKTSYRRGRPHQAEQARQQQHLRQLLRPQLPPRHFCNHWHLRRHRNANPFILHHAQRKLNTILPPIQIIIHHSG